MAYERYRRSGERSGYNDRNDLADYGQDNGNSGDPYRYSSARDYAASNEGGRDEIGDRGRQDFGQRERAGYGGNDRDEWRGQNVGRDDHRGGQRQPSYGSDRDAGRDPYRQQRGTYDRQPQNYQGQNDRNRGRDDDRGFVARAGDEVRSWFGDEEAERRREQDERRDSRAAPARDDHYHSWRNEQIAAFDRDYDEYRQENQSKFHNEFSSFRTERQSQRDLLNKVEEHAEVVGSDGEHVGTVDKVRGDRIILTKNDADAGGKHHSIPSRWLQSADGNRVTLRKSAAEAKAHWRDEERNGALFGQDDGQRDEGARRNEDGSSTGGTNLNRSFSGTY